MYLIGILFQQGQGVIENPCEVYGSPKLYFCPLYCLTQNHMRVHFTCKYDSLFYQNFNNHLGLGYYHAWIAH